MTHTFVVRLQHKDPAAYDALVAQYADVLYGYIYQSTDDCQQSEELLRATFLRVLEQIDRYRSGDPPLLVWLHRIAHTVMRDASISARPVAHAHKPIAPLSLEERQVIMLRCVANMSLPEIGYVLAKSNSAVKQLQYQALRAMHDWLR